MSVISEMLDSRRLPALGFEGVDPETRRKEIVKLLSEHIYGCTPDFKSTVTAEPFYQRKSVFADKGNSAHYKVTVTTPGGDFTFPLYLLTPATDKKVPLIINLTFEMKQPSGIVPDEEILDRGVAMARIYYQDIAADSRDDPFTAGVAPLFPREDGCRTLWGKLGMWAWAASRALDFLMTLDLFDPEKIAVQGHSRLGKTALWCAAQDTRFTYCFSNNAGCSGDAVTRGKAGEQIAFITKTFPYWFCDKYKDYVDDGIEQMPFDQHFLLAAIAPRHVAVGASHLDTWADPDSEFLCCKAASDAWNAWGKPGFIAPDDRLPEIGESFDDGYVAYHKRRGSHCCVREDWMTYIDFMLK